MKKIKLKLKPTCYYQLQGVEIQKRDLVIYTNKIFHIENTKFDKNKWTKEILPDLTNFYFEFMSRSILYKVKMDLFLTNVPILCLLKLQRSFCLLVFSEGIKW